MKTLLLSLLLSCLMITSKADSADPGDPDTWQVTANNYQYSMSITTALYFDGVESQDVTDKIVAFVNDDCRGVAQPIIYMPETDTYLAFMLVYSNIVSGDTVTFYMYDESEDHLVEVAKKLIFASNATYGNSTDPYLSITTYDATFQVLAGTDPLSGASITLDGYGNQTTDVNGEVTFLNVAPSDSIPYSVLSDGFDSYAGSIGIKSEHISEIVNLNLTKYFKVTDGTDPIANVEISLEGYSSKITNLDGEASFSGLAPSDSIFYSVQIDKYDSYEDSISVSPTGSSIENIVLNLTTYSVSFYVSDNSLVVVGASVLLDGYGTKLTDDNGYVEFLGVLPSDGIEYSITTPSYNTYSNSIAVVDENVTKNIDVDLTAYTVTFMVIDGNVPVENARVLLSGYEVLSTDIYGNAVFENVILSENIGFEITTDGYNTYYDEVAVIDRAISEKVSLILTTYNTTFTISDGLNPVKDAMVSFEIAGPERVIDFSVESMPSYFQNEGNASWKIDNSCPFQGQYAVISDKIYDNQFTEIFFDKTVVTGDFSFYAKLSSEEGNDFLIFYIDGIEQGSWSGELDWEKLTFPVLSGEHNFKWVYKKDGSSAEGSDCAWIDYIQYPSENMVVLTASTDNIGRSIFTNLLPYDSISYTITDNRYNNVTDYISIYNENVDENINLDINLSFQISKEFNKEFVTADSVYLEGYGSKVIDDKGIATFENVIPVNTISYSIMCEDYDILDDNSSALINDTLNEEVFLSRYDVTFQLSYKDVPVSNLTVEIENYDFLLTDDNGVAIFNNVIPNSISYIVDDTYYLRKEGEFILDDENLNIQLEILPVYYLQLNINSAANTGSIPVIGATIELTTLSRSSITSIFGETEFNEITPNDSIYFTVTAMGYYDTSGIIAVVDRDVVHEIIIDLMPVLEASNFISPNGDGVNDYWEIYNCGRYQEFSVDIYSSAGEKIYHTTDYENFKWDGTVNGNKIPDGIYYYFITSPEKDMVFKGIINLIN